MPIEIKVVRFQELSNIELYQILQLRTEVFVVEQDCVYQDMDDKDYESLHVVLLLDNIIAAYTRIYQSSEASHIGRVVVKKEHRKKRDESKKKNRRKTKEKQKEERTEEGKEKKKEESKRQERR